MLGMRQSSEPIKGQFARDIRMQMWRVASGHVNAEDKALAGLHKDVQNEQKYVVTWKH